MDFKTAVTSVLKDNYTNFKGRARRSEFWYFYLFDLIISAIFSVLSAILGNVPVVGTLITILSALVALAILVPGLAVSFRRMHDIGKSAWWFLLGLIPLVGWIIVIVLLAKDSRPGENAYGPNPKGI